MSRYPATSITRALRLCSKCHEYREVTKGCKMPNAQGHSVGRNKFVCAGCAKTATVIQY